MALAPEPHEEGERISTPEEWGWALVRDEPMKAVRAESAEAPFKSGEAPVKVLAKAVPIDWEISRRQQRAGAHPAAPGRQGDLYHRTDPLWLDRPAHRAVPHWRTAPRLTRHADAFRLSLGAGLYPPAVPPCHPHRPAKRGHGLHAAGGQPDDRRAGRCAAGGRDAGQPRLLSLSGGHVRRHQRRFDLRGAVLGPPRRFRRAPHAGHRHGLWPAGGGGAGHSLHPHAGEHHAPAHQQRGWGARGRGVPAASSASSTLCRASR